MLKKYNVSTIQINLTRIQFIWHAFILYNTTRKIQHGKIQRKKYNMNNITQKNTTRKITLTQTPTLTIVIKVSSYQ